MKPFTLLSFFAALLALPIHAEEAAPAKATATIDAAPYLDANLTDCGLQNAIDAALPGGGIVKIPAGIYRLRRGLVLGANVQIQGAGMDKTILTPWRRVLRVDAAGDLAGDTVQLKELPDDVVVGTAGMQQSAPVAGWSGATRPVIVTALDRAAKTVILRAPYGYRDMKAGRGCLMLGVSAALARPVKKGDAEIELTSTALFKPGDELTFGSPDNFSMPSHAFVKAVRGNTLVLESPAQVDFALFPEKIGTDKPASLVWALFPLIHGANFAGAAVRDLTIQGQGNFAQAQPAMTRYTLSGIHFYNVKNVTLQRVAVRDWPSDGISVQTGSHCAILDSEATGCLQNGLHPGTGLTDSRIENNLSARNGAGLYFCWHNERHVLRNNRFIENTDGGITGLGNPGDWNNIIEGNLIARNGGPGIVINGGMKSGNIIRGNTIENNSQTTPGKFPGIALWATLEDARNYTIEGNTIRDTQDKPTQFVGIEEKNGLYNKKPTTADENIIKGNRFTHHKTADIVVSGAATVVAGNTDATVTRSAPATAP